MPGFNTHRNEIELNVMFTKHEAPQLKLNVINLLNNHNWCHTRDHNLQKAHGLDDPQRLKVEMHKQEH